VKRTALLGFGEFLFFEIELLFLEREPIPQVVELTFALVEVDPLGAPLFGLLDRGRTARRSLRCRRRPSERAVARFARRVVDQCRRARRSLSCLSIQIRRLM
jgi:hypothetical protein